MLDYVQMQKDYVQCYADKSRITFIEKYFFTYDASTGKKKQYTLFPRQKIFLKTLSENKNIICLKSRQSGASTVSSAWAAAECAFATEETPLTILCIANTLTQANELIIKVKDFLNMVPRWYWGEEYFSEDPSSENMKRKIFVKSTRSEITLINGSRVIARASGPNAARGISAVSVLILDEAAFIEDGAAVYASATATMATNPNSKTIMISTPYGMDELYYQTYRQAITKQNNFSVVQFYWYQDPRFNKNLKWFKKDKKTGENFEYVDEVIDESGTIKYDEEHWAKMIQDGWTPTSPWYEDMKRQFNNDTMKIAQELDVSFMGSSDNVVAQEYIDQQNKLNVREPLEEMKDPLAEETWFWKPPIEGHRYILSADPSRGTSSDATAIEVIDIDGEDDNGLPIIEQVMEYVGKRLGDDIGGLIYNYATLYNNAFVVVDATGGSGDAALLTLLNMGYKNLYYEDMSQKRYTIQNPTKRYDSYTDKLPGFHFQGNRYPVLSSFASYVRSNEIKIRSQRVISELQTWIFDKTGRMDHQHGAHDDTICSLAMALFVMQYTINRLEKTVARDKAILSSYISKTAISESPRQYQIGENVTPKAYPKPFYKTGGEMKKIGKGSFIWIKH